MPEQPEQPEVPLTPPTPDKWEELLLWRPEFPELIHRWLRTLKCLALYSCAKEDDLLGAVILTFMVSSIQDINDLMTLSHSDSHYGATYFLRTLFERTVTLQYLFDNEQEVENFVGYDAIDWQQVLLGIHALTGMSLEETSKQNLEKKAGEARARYKQTPCPECGLRKQTSWTPLSVKDMANKVGLGHLQLHAYLVSSKLMHPTLWGAKQRYNLSAGMYNTIQAAHELLIHTLLIHRRHFMKGRALTPMMIQAIRDYLSIWVFAETSFGGILTEGEVRKGRRIYYG